MAFTRSGVRSPSPPYRLDAQTPGLTRQQTVRLSPAEQNPRRLGVQSLAGIAQLVEHNLAKVGVAGSSPVSRSGRLEGRKVGTLEGFPFTFQPSNSPTTQATRGGAAW